MYNRYIPETNGVYKRQVIEECHAPAPHAPLPEGSAPIQTISQSAGRSPAKNNPVLDLGDLLLLCIILLILLDADPDDQLSIFIAAIAVFLIP